MTDKQPTARTIPYRRPFRLNVGLFMFLIIFIYVLISVLTYLTSHKTEVYEVRSGSLSDNQVYQGIALRNESVVNSGSLTATTPGRSISTTRRVREFRKADWLFLWMRPER